MQTHNTAAGSTGQAQDSASTTLRQCPGAPDGSDQTVAILHFAQEQQDLTAVMFDDANNAQELLSVLQAVEEPLLFEVDDLPAWPTRRRRTLLKLIADLGPRAILQGPGQTEHRDLLDAVLDMLVGPEDVKRCGNAREAALEAAVLVHSDSLQAACAKIAQRFKDVGLTGERADRLLGEARRLAEEFCQQPSGRVVRVSGVVPDSPADPNAIVPPGWELTPDAVVRKGEELRTIITAPVVIVQRLKDVADGSESVQVAWRRDGNWQHRVVERSLVAGTRTIVDLADWGLPVTSNNAGEVVDYLADFESVNSGIIPVTRVSQQMGWHGEGDLRGFLWGREFLTRDAVASRGSGDERTALIFQGADEGDEQLADGFRLSGAWAGWREAVEPVRHYPRVQVAVYAALTPPLLTLLKSPNFVLEFAGPTSQGKTTAQRICASVWGNPDERSAGAALGTWDSTRVWRERACAIWNNIPVILDDTKRARDPQHIAQTLYDVAGGRGRGRGSVQGVARVSTWTTVLISSGEGPITGFTEDGGTRARVLSLWGSPFGTTDPATGQVVRGINEAIYQDYGHAGPRFVQYLLNHMDDLPVWQQLYQEAVAAYVDLAGANAVAGRMAAHLAALDVTARLAHEAGILPWEFTDPVDGLWEELVRETPDADVARRALEYVLSWAGAHQHEFWSQGQHASTGSRPTAWAGRWDCRSGPDPSQWQYLGIFPHKLEQILREGGYDKTAVLRTWRDREWLLITGESGFQYRARVDGQPMNLIAVTRAAFDEIVGAQDQAAS